jgi:1-phosphofructokinase
MIGIVAPILAFEEFVEVRDGRAQNLCFHPAGQGVNAARAVRELGEECTLVGFNGGESGIILRALLDAYGLGHRLVAVRGETAGVVKVTGGHSEQVAYSLAPPAVSRHEADDLYAAAALLVLECRVLVLSTCLADGMPPAFFARLVRLANRHHVRTIADLPPALLPDVIAARPTLIKPNVDQLRELYALGAEPALADLRAVAEDLRARGAGAVVLSRGAAGALLVEEAGAWRLIPPAVEAVVEAGAGDCMTGGIAAGLAQGQALVEAVRLGAAAGCAKVMRHGLGTSKRDVTQRLLPHVQVQPLEQVVAPARPTALGQWLWTGYSKTRLAPPAMHDGAPGRPDAGE